MDNNEYYTSDDGNLEEGQATEDVGQDEGTTQSKSSSDWKNQAKYFQSEKDKLYAENEKLRQLAKVGEYIQSRPDVAEKLSGYISGNDKPDVQMDKDDFDPWEAYNDPQSKSYQFREQEIESRINNRVDQAVDQAVGSVKKDVAVDKLVGSLKERGLNNEQVKSFMEFASTNPAKYGVDGAIKMWQSVNSGKVDTNSNPNPLDKVRQNQQVPTSTGILQGEQPRKTSDDDAIWKGILNATPAMGKDGKLP